ncbi:MAG: PAAR domain-containing protein [Candidatus Wallbacteria bacterium]|nr:PAAR domain-containing protein [Candidatus Wallbacteria bacterium]
MVPRARFGDATDHGGTITTGSPTVSIDGLPGARLGDTHSCPIHGDNPIVSGSGVWTNDGLPCARLGDTTACGATIVSGSPVVYLD